MKTPSLCTWNQLYPYGYCYFVCIIPEVGGGQIAGTREAGDDPPVRKKKKYIYGGRGSRKMWLTNKKDG